MWIVLGVVAIITALLNIHYASKKKPNVIFGFLSLSLTALTVCAFYSDVANRVMLKDWIGLMDVVPTISGALLLCVIGAIIVNGIPLLIKKDK